MKKKYYLFFVLALMLVGLSIWGTFAYFTTSFSSGNNIATAAKFDVEALNANGGKIGDAQFQLDNKLYPGLESLEVYNFKIDQKNTEVPVEYQVNLHLSGELFPSNGSSPVHLTLQRLIDGQWTNVDYSKAIEPTDRIDTFRILVDWPHGNHDIDFAGKEGEVHLEIIATQVDLVVDVEGAKGKIDQAKSELAALDTVNSSFNKGNFTKAQAAAVQALIDAARTYVESFSKSSEKDALLGEIQSLQTALDKKIASRYVYYEVVEGETNFEQLKLSITGEVFSIANGRTQNNNPMYVSGMTQKNALYLKYTNQSFVKPVVGDTASFNIRFNNGVKNIDATFTNLGDGKWKIESEWLVPQGK